MILVSACLAGFKCRYNGKSKPNQKVIRLIKQGRAIPICPEQLGGLTTPRTPAELSNRKVITKTGKDVTKQFNKGAKLTLELARLFNVNKAILARNSPSCGVGKTYDGAFTGTLVNKDGITAALLRKNKIKIISDEEI